MTKHKESPVSQLYYDLIIIRKKVKIKSKDTETEPFLDLDRVTPVADLGGARDGPTSGPKCLYFHAGFRKIGQTIGWSPLTGIRVLALWKSWICHWTLSTFTTEDIIDD